MIIKIQTTKWIDNFHSSLMFDDDCYLSNFYDHYEVNILIDTVDSFLHYYHYYLNFYFIYRFHHH